MNIQAHRLSPDYKAKELIAHRTDVAFVRTAQEDDFITSKLLHRQPIVVVLADTNPLSRFASLSVSDIADQPIVGYPNMLDQYFTRLYGMAFGKLALNQILSVKLSISPLYFSL